MIDMYKFSKGLFLMCNLMLVLTEPCHTMEDEHYTVEKLINITGPTVNDLLANDEKEFNQKLVPDEEKTYTPQQIGQIMDSIQLGIKIGIDTNIQDNKIEVNDYGYIKKITFTNYIDNNTKKLYAYLIFIIYAPLVFDHFRHIFDITSKYYVSSFCDSPLRQISNPGASRSIFYITPNDKFLMKTVQQSEEQCLMALLEEYKNHFVNNPRSLLPKFSGYFQLRNKTINIELISMNNLLPSNIKMHQKYDLKGSTFGRVASGQEKLKRSPTYKDIDFTDDHHPNGLFLKPETRLDLLIRIKNDVELLKRKNVMDYSLLMGVYNIDEPLDANADKSSRDLRIAAEIRWNSLMSNSSINETNNGANGKIVPDTNQASLSGSIAAKKSNGHRLLLFMGIIDILQTYRVFKELEYNLKALKLIITTRQLQSVETISVQSPDFYASRFIKFMTESVFKSLDDMHTQSFNGPTTLSSKQKSIDSVDKCPSIANCFKKSKVHNQNYDE